MSNETEAVRAAESIGSHAHHNDLTDEEVQAAADDISIGWVEHDVYTSVEPADALRILEEVQTRLASDIAGLRDDVAKGRKNNPDA